MTRTDVPVPPAMAALPLDKHGRPVPWFVSWIDGQPDHRVADMAKLEHATWEGLCWTCGGQCWQDSEVAFVIGPMCGVNRVSAEPPSHVDCAVYSARACPFLSTPQMTRRERGLPENRVDPAGIMITRNPGVTLVWITERFTVDRVDDGMLFDLGDPVACRWFARGRDATRAEVLASLASGMPILERIAQCDGPKGMFDLGRRVGELDPWLPQETQEE